MVLTLPEEVQDHRGNLVQDMAHLREHKGSAFLPNVTATSTRGHGFFFAENAEKSKLLNLAQVQP